MERRLSATPQQLPPGCPYANKAGLVVMVLLGTGRAQPKTNLALYDVHLAQANGRFKKAGKPMTLEEAGRASLENEKALGWDKLPPLVHAIRPPDPALMAEKSKRAKTEKAETGETAGSGASTASSTSGSEGQAGGSRARAQPKASERGKTAEEVITALENGATYLEEKAA